MAARSLLLDPEESPRGPERDERDGESPSGASPKPAERPAGLARKPTDPREAGARLQKARPRSRSNGRRRLRLLERGRPGAGAPGPTGSVALGVRVVGNPAGPFGPVAGV